MLEGDEGYGFLRLRKGPELVAKIRRTNRIRNDVKTGIWHLKKAIFWAKTRRFGLFAVTD
ncbi:MAG: hypothetical protein ABR907_06845 [Terracidiphilus sp.]